MNLQKKKTFGIRLWETRDLFAQHFTKLKKADRNSRFTKDFLTKSTIDFHRLCKGILSNWSYGPPFFEKLTKVSELFSKMTFSIDLGFFVCQRYMLIALGKIAKWTQRHPEAFVKYEDNFSLGFLSESGDHLPGERDLTVNLA